MRLFPSLSILLCVVWLSLPEPVKAQDNSGMRQWTDDGNRKIIARFVGVRGPTVTLQTENGKQYSFSLAKLSEADQKIAKELQKAADDKDPAKQRGTVAGILFDVKPNWITVKADGEEEPVRYNIVDGPDHPIAQAMKGIFGASRVELSYEKVNGTHQLVSIKKQVLQAKGTFLGTVVQVHDRFWLEVKPRTGPPDAFAPGANYNDKAFMDLLNSLRPGDHVTLGYFTDLERHRIRWLTRTP